MSAKIWLTKTEPLELCTFPAFCTFIQELGQKPEILEAEGDYNNLLGLMEIVFGDNEPVPRDAQKALAKEAAAAAELPGWSEQAQEILRQVKGLAKPRRRARRQRRRS